MSIFATTSYILETDSLISSIYLPWNDFGLEMMGPANRQLFAAGDVRANQDWLILGFETLLLREHNRLCNVSNMKEKELLPL
jgi:hypothetical protein